MQDKIISYLGKGAQRRGEKSRDAKYGVAEPRGAVSGAAVNAGSRGSAQDAPHVRFHRGVKRGESPSTPSYLGF